MTDINNIETAVGKVPGKAPMYDSWVLDNTLRERAARNIQAADLMFKISVEEFASAVVAIHGMKDGK